MTAARYTLVLTMLAAVTAPAAEKPAHVKVAAGGARIVFLSQTAIADHMSHDIRRTRALPGWPITGGLPGADPAPCAETVPGPSTQAFSRLAKELANSLTIPFLAIAPKIGRPFNTLVLAGPDGALLLHYRKLSPWPCAVRPWVAPGGRGHAHVDTPRGRLALLICFDINTEPPRFRETCRDILLCSIAWVDRANSGWFENRQPAFVRNNDMSVSGANWTVPSQPIGAAAA
ncbi:MAG TPA: carbon-nitrogen hydrolase family protein [Candidatus Brocadiia bacterium]|nr:carbon-nitrogen hydrolase family protein [Candidatus Brocadiia bacterium]